MDHDLVVREKISERYLLNELEPRLRDEFEEHFFECGDCAQDVRAGALFVQESKTILAEEAAHGVVPRAVVAVPARSKAGWFGWLRPAFAVPVMALLLAVVGYQNLVTLPRLSAALNHPQVLSWATVNIGTWGYGGPTITTSPDKDFLLFVRIPPDSSYSSYSAKLLDPSGKQEWSLSIPASSASDVWPIRVPAARRKDGTYTVLLLGNSSAGESKEVGRASFDLQIQK